MFFVASKLLDVFLSPLTWAIALLAVSLVQRGRLARLGRTPAVAGLVVLYVFSIDPVANLLWMRIEAGAKRTYRDDVTYDAVIVLGGLLDHPGGSLDVGYNDNVERLLAGYALLREGRAKTVLLSGGNASLSDAPAEADVLAEQLRAWGVEPARIVVEPDSRNTHENAVFSARIVAAHGWQKVLLVTSAFHMPRAAGCFAKEGLSPDLLPVDSRVRRPTERFGIFPQAGALSLSAAAAHEWFGRVVYRLRGYST